MEPTTDKRIRLDCLKLAIACIPPRASDIYATEVVDFAKKLESYVNGNS